jgi:hypothetical protein
MLVGGIGNAIMLWIWLLQSGQHPSFATLVLISCLQTMFEGFCRGSYCQVAAGLPVPNTTTFAPIGVGILLLV